VIAIEKLMPVDSLQKQEGPSAPVCSGRATGSDLCRAGVGMTRRRTVIATELVNACRFPAKAGGPQYLHTLRSPGRRKSIGSNSMAIKTAKNSEKQPAAPLFFRDVAAQNSRISAEENSAVADNSLEEQQKQRTPRLAPSLAAQG
jgi:hypothetical protein